MPRYNITSTVVRFFTWAILLIVVLSTFFNIISPLLPTEDEYTNGFPQDFWKNFRKWMPGGLFRHIILFNEYYNVGRILVILSNFFLLLLVASIGKVLSAKKLPEIDKLHEYYLKWAISSLLITIVFVTKSVNYKNVRDIGIGVMLIALSVVILFLLSRYIEKQKTNSKTKDEKKGK